jgi:hypothetical protein
MIDDAPQLRGEVRKLSSLGSEIGVVVGIVFASLWTAAVLVSIYASHPGVGMALSGLGMALVVWLFVLIGRPKVVETDGYWLLVSDLSKTVWIPLRHVVSVHQRWFGGQRVHVEVGCDTPFGREFFFEPQFGLGPLFGPHPVVEELRELAANAKAADSRPGFRAS